MNSITGLGHSFSVVIPDSIRDPGHLKREQYPFIMNPSSGVFSLFVASSKP
jgi:hypothetical protein